MYDHVWLDVQRIENQKYIDKKVIDDGETIVDTLKNVEGMKEQIDAHENKINNYFKKMDKAQTDIIGVISIFSTIILAFVGGMAFSTSILENINKPTIYRLFFILIVLAFVLINIIWGLLSIVRFINEMVINDTVTNSPELTKKVEKRKIKKPKTRRKKVDIL